MGLTSSLLVSEKTIPNFQPTKYEGVWYELARYNSIESEKECSYVTSKYKWNETDKTMKMINTCHFDDGENLSVEVLAQPTLHSGKFVIDYKTKRMAYWIHWTDYKNYSIVGEPNGHFVWILARKRNVTRTYKDLLINAISRFGYNPLKLVWNYYPQKYNIEKETKNNKKELKVLETQKGIQVTLNSLKPGEKLDWEVHSVGQFTRVESGIAIIKLSGQTLVLKSDDMVVIPAGVKHYIENKSQKTTLKLYSVYGGTVH